MMWPIMLEHLTVVIKEERKSNIIDKNDFGIYIKKKFKTIFEEVCAWVCVCDVRYFYLEYIEIQY